MDYTTDIRRILIWTITPNTISFDKEKTYNSGDIIEEGLSIQATIEKVKFFIQSTNETGEYETRPDFIIWVPSQLVLLKERIPTLNNLIGKEIILQDRCRDIFKYNLQVQNFSLPSIAEIMAIEGEDYEKFAMITIKTERALKTLSKTLKDGKVT